MAPSQFSKVFAVVLGVLACGVDTQGEASKRAALEYGATTPFVMGADPHEYGAEDPLNVYSDVPGYAAVWLDAATTSVAPGGQGVDVQNSSYHLVIMTTASELSETVVQRIRGDACASPTVCDSNTTIATVPYSLRDLRSVAGWVLRSPLGSDVVPRVHVETGSWQPFLDIEATASAEPLVREMMESASIPAAMYRLKVGRPYSP